MLNVLITGGGRGIGLELARQLNQKPATEIAKILVTTRAEPSKELQELMSVAGNRIIHILCDVNVQESVNQMAVDVDAKLDGEGLDMLINNVGTAPNSPKGTIGMDPEQLKEAFNVNVVSVHRVSAAVIPALERSKEKKIVMMSTTVGCLSYGRLFPRASPSYKVTKAALNMLMIQYACELEERGFTVVGITPGWLKTDLGSEYADLDVEVGVEAVVRILSNLDSSSSGKLLNVLVPGWENASGPNQYDGKVVSW